VTAAAAEAAEATGDIDAPPAPLLLLQVIADVVAASLARATLLAHPSYDVWSLGCVLYQVTHSPFLPFFLSSFLPFLLLCFLTLSLLFHPVATVDSCATPTVCHSSKPTDETACRWPACLPCRY
jgi:serine/threonine protein kinase